VYCFSDNFLTKDHVTYFEGKACDEGLISTKDNGPWHMVRRKGIP